MVAQVWNAPIFKGAHTMAFGSPTFFRIRHTHIIYIIYHISIYIIYHRYIIHMSYTSHIPNTFPPGKIQTPLAPSYALPASAGIRRPTGSVLRLWLERMEAPASMWSGLQYFTWSTCGLCWLVVWTYPSEKKWVRQLGWWNSQYMESHKNPWLQTTNNFFFGMIHDDSPNHYESTDKWEWGPLMVLWSKNERAIPNFAWPIPNPIWSWLISECSAV